MSAATVLLVSANREHMPVPVYPLALPRLAAAVEAAGHRAVQFDALVHGLETLPQAVRQVKPDLAGVSIRNIDNTTAEAPHALADGAFEAIRLIRDAASTPIVLGGSGFSLFPELLAERVGAEYSVVGPGETALCRILDALNGGTSPPPSAPEPAHLPVPAHHDPEILAYYWRTARMIGVQTKCGCPRSCSYCTYPRIDGSLVRPADPGEAADAVERLYRDHGVTYVFFADSVFNLRRESELALAEELRRRNHPLSWGAYFSPAGLDHDYLRALKASGLTHLEFGTDALSDRMLSSYRKGFTVRDVLETSTRCRELGLNCAHFLLFGGPGETADTVRESAANARILTGAVFFPRIGVRVYPKTALHETVRQELGLPGAAYLKPVFYFAPGLDARTITALLKEEVGGARNWIFPHQYAAFAPILRRLRKKGHRGPLWERCAQ